MKILYGVPSEGMGHATRSKVVIDYLLIKQHDVQIVSSDRAFQFLQKHFGNRVHQIEGFHLAYKNAVVSVGATILKSLQSIPKQVMVNFNKYKFIAETFNPNLIISDFESFTQFYSQVKSIPCISIDNMQVINRCELDISISKNEKANYLLAKGIIKAKVAGAKHYFITSFFFPKIKKTNTSLVHPILRNEILVAKTKSLNHIVVYQTSSTQKDLIQNLQLLPNEKFIVYGFNKEEQHGNVQLKVFSEKEFIANFASAKAVLANGGFSFLSEAVYLQKPILSVPIKNQFEQFVNASYIENLQYGRHFESFSADYIKAFLYELPRFKLALKGYEHDGNKALWEGLERFLR